MPTDLKPQSPWYLDARKVLAAIAALALGIVGFLQNPVSCNIMEAGRGQPVPPVPVTSEPLPVEPLPITSGSVVPAPVEPSPDAPALEPSAPAPDAPAE
jgi:hypothetical protein